MSYNPHIFCDLLTRKAEMEHIKIIITLKKLSIKMEAMDLHKERFSEYIKIFYICQNHRQAHDKREIYNHIAEY